MSKNKKANSQNKNKKQNQSSANIPQGSLGRKHEFTLTVPRSICTIIPDRFVTTLRWWKSVPINLSATSTAAVRFSPSSAFDPDPLGTTRPVGFDQLSNLYNSYRVLRSTAFAEGVNAGTVPITMTLLPANTDPGTTPVPAYITASRLQSYAQSKTGALVGGPICKLSSSMSTQKMFGNKMIEFDDNFAALVNAIPVNNWYWVVTFYAPAVAPVGFILSFYMDMEVEFYDRANLAQGS